MRKSDTVRAQTVQDWRVDMWVVQAMNRVKSLHIRGEPEDVVGFLFLHCRLKVATLVQGSGFRVQGGLSRNIPSDSKRALVIFVFVFLILFLLKFIREHADEPFFCYIATNAPHGPLNVETRYIDMYRESTPHEDRARFYGMITNIDENFGKLAEVLEELGIVEDTILIFMSDNGTASGCELDSSGFSEEGPGSFNAGMRGKKGSPYEGGHRVPFLLRYPAGGFTGGKDIDTLTSYVDFMPTLLDLCCVTPPAEKSFHGRSLLPLMNGESGGDWDERVVVSDTQRIANPMKWRLIDGSELYDLDTDPGQTTDISDPHPDIVAELRKEYDRWWELVSEQFDRDVPIALGKDVKAVKLTTHDLRNEACMVAFNHRQVREGLVTSGFWEIDIRQPGRIEIEISRWPEETGYAISSGIEGDDVEWRKDCIQEKMHPITQEEWP